MSSHCEDNLAMMFARDALARRRFQQRELPVQPAPASALAQDQELALAQVLES
jgi:hypothetical protein